MKNSSSKPARAPYVRPTLEALGAWSTLTLQQSIPVAVDVPFAGFAQVK